MAQEILYVEDDEGLQELVKVALERDRFKVTICPTAASALERFRHSRPDLVIFDIMLPDGDGLEISSEMARMPGQKVPFIFLTAMGDKDTRLQCFAAGARDYIAKPFEIEELVMRVKLQLALKRHSDDLAKRVFDLEISALARQDLVDMVLHDLKNPIASIRTALELLDFYKEQGPVERKQAELVLTSAIPAAEFVLLTLNDLLDISRGEQAGLKPRLGPVELEPLIKRLESIYAGRALKDQVPLSHSLAADARTMNTDESLLFRLLANLISNAMNFSKSGNSVEVAVTRAGEAVRFAVADRGPGVPDSEKHRIFDKYATTFLGGRKMAAGHGIGLTFCRLATMALRGRLWVEDRPGGGSLFIMELPDKPALAS